MKNLIRMVCLAVLFITAGQSLNASFISFDDLSNLPARNSFQSLNLANGGTSLLGGAVWDSRFYVVGDKYVELYHNQGGTNPFATPHSGNYAMFNANGDDGLFIETSQTLAGLWLARPDMGIGPRGTNKVTIRAMNGANILDSKSIDLTSTTPVFLDTSSFSSLSGIDRYRIDRVATGLDGFGGGHYVVDSFQFNAVPEPASMVIWGIGALGMGLVARRRAKKVATV